MFKPILVVLLSCSLTAGCALGQKKVEKQIQPDVPVDCSTAEADLVALQDEKVSAAERASAGARSIIPISLVGGVLTGTAGTKARVASGKYNEMIDARIEKIERTCGVTAPAPAEEASAPADEAPALAEEALAPVEGSGEQAPSPSE